MWTAIKTAIYGPTCEALAEKTSTNSASRIKDIRRERISITRQQAKLKAELESEIIPTHGVDSDEANSIFFQLAELDHTLANMRQRIAHNVIMNAKTINTMQDSRQVLDLVEDTVRISRLRAKAAITAKKLAHIDVPEVPSGTEIIDEVTMQTIQEQIQIMEKPIGMLDRHPEVYEDDRARSSQAEPQEETLADRAAKIAEAYRAAPLKRAPRIPNRIP